MRRGVAHLACLLLLLSSMAALDVRGPGSATMRTPGDVFVRNLLLQATAEEPETESRDFGGEADRSLLASVECFRDVADVKASAAAQAAHVHSVTGSSL